MSDTGNSVSPLSPWELERPTVASNARISFEGRRGALFWLALKTGVLTILTLGFYRFWMKTRMRRFYWSSIRIDGHPMEYVGDPFEKLLGFFIAVVILTFYIGIVNLGLMFISFSYFQEAGVGYMLSFIGVVPIWFYATYRARRYVLGRTRWRAVRFALEPGAWGYAWRALLHWLITVMTLGLLWPRMTFWLEKYKTDRTFFGSARLHQGGSFWALYRATVPLIMVACLWALFVSWLTLLAPLLPNAPDQGAALVTIIDDFIEGRHVPTAWDRPQRLWLILPLLFLTFYAVIHYRFGAKRILANHKSADGIQLCSALKPMRISVIYVLGTTLAYFALLIGLATLIFSAAWMLGAGMLAGQHWMIEVFLDLPDWIRFAVLALVYLSAFLAWNVLHNTFVTFPLMKHMAVTTSLSELDGLAGISQRQRDAFAEAEGFAEALDLGAAI